MQTSLVHSVAPPFQIESTLLGFDLVFFRAQTVFLCYSKRKAKGILPMKKLRFGIMEAAYRSIKEMRSFEI